jgi:hypothetical protein
MKKIQANNNPDAFALVDDDVAEIIKDMGLKFCVNNKGYFCSTSHSIKLPGMTEKKRLQLHHFVWILKTGEEPNSEVDHIDRSPLNNQLSNLRLATRQEQNQNKGKKKSNSSGYIGVCHYHCINKYGNEYDYWSADIMRPDGKHESKLFPYTDIGKIKAARYYDSKARDYFGEFHGQLNFPDDNQTA